MEVADKAALYRQGEKCHQIFCINTGHVKLIRNGHNGNQFITAILQAGDFFGLSLADQNGLAQETAIAN